MIKARKRIEDLASSRLLAYLREHANRDVPRKEIEKRVFDLQPGMITRRVDAAVYKARKMLAPSEQIVTLRGFGFRLERQMDMRASA